MTVWSNPPVIDEAYPPEDQFVPMFDAASGTWRAQRVPAAAIQTGVGDPNNVVTPIQQYAWYFQTDSGGGGGIWQAQTTDKNSWMQLGLIAAFATFELVPTGSVTFPTSPMSDTAILSHHYMASGGGAVLYAPHVVYGAGAGVQVSKTASGFENVALYDTNGFDFDGTIEVKSLDGSNLMIATFTGMSEQANGVMTLTEVDHVGTDLSISGGNSIVTAAGGRYRVDATVTNLGWD